MQTISAEPREEQKRLCCSVHMCGAERTARLVEMAGGMYLVSMVAGWRRYELKKMHPATTRACRWPCYKAHVVSCTCHCSSRGCAASIPLQLLHQKFCAEGAATIHGRSSCTEARRRPSIALRQRACLSVTACKVISSLDDTGEGWQWEGFVTAPAARGEGKQACSPTSSHGKPDRNRVTMCYHGTER